MGRFRAENTLAQSKKEKETVSTFGLLILIVVLVLLFGGGGGYYYRRRGGW